MRHSITTKTAATVFAAYLIMLPSGAARAQHLHASAGGTSTPTIQGPCFRGGLWNVEAAGPEPVCEYPA